MIYWKSFHALIMIIMSMIMMLNATDLGHTKPMTDYVYELSINRYNVLALINTRYPISNDYYFFHIHILMVSKMFLIDIDFGRLCDKSSEKVRFRFSIGHLNQYFASIKRFIPA